MADQLALDLALPALVMPGKHATIEERFAAFRAANPHVEQALLRKARELRDLGATHLSVRDLWGLLRIDRLRTSGQDDYRLSNTYTSRYGRWLMDADPSLAELIETRELKAA